MILLIGDFSLSMFDDFGSAAPQFSRVIKYLGKIIFRLVLVVSSANVLSVFVNSVAVSRNFESFEKKL